MILRHENIARTKFECHIEGVFEVKIMGLAPNLDAIYMQIKP